MADPKMFAETLHDGYAQHMRIDEVLFERRTEHQHMLIFRNNLFGRVMALDGIVQTTEADEFIYHEMLTHVPIFAHGHAREILIIGGGDGGMLRETCKHATVERVTQVEIDQAVVDMCVDHLPNHSSGAYDDPRLNLVIDDGAHFVESAADRFDVIIIDSTDPIGPGESLFTNAFHSACQRCLAPGGVLVTQNGVVFMQPSEAAGTARILQSLYADWHFYVAAVPTYVGGNMTFGWGAQESSLREVDVALLSQRFAGAGIITRYYTPEVHKAAFALPQFVMELVGKAKS